MTYLLDTCAISELRKAVPVKVNQWFADKDPETFYVSVVTVAEIADGINRLATSKKKKELEEWFNGYFMQRFDEKILPINTKIAKAWGTT